MILDSKGNQMYRGIFVAMFLTYDFQNIGACTRRNASKRFESLSTTFTVDH